MDESGMWGYVKRYLPFAMAAALFMVAEVLMDLLLPGLMRRAVDEGILGIGSSGPGGMGLVIRLGLVMTALTLLGGLCGSLNNVLVHFASQGMGNAMRKDCFRRCMAFSFPQMDRLGAGSMVTRLTNDITQVQNFIAQFVRGGVRTLMMLGGSVVFLFLLDPRFGQITLAAMPLLLGCAILCVARVMPLFPRMQEQLDRLNAIMQEDASGLRLIKACVRESYEELRFGRASKELAATTMRVLLLFAFLNPVMNLLLSMVIVVIIYAGSLQAGTGSATPGTVMAGITYAARLLNAVLMVVMLFQGITRGYVSWKRVRELLLTGPGLEEGSFCGETAVHGLVEFRDVSFSFPGAAQPALQDITLTVRSGETVAVMGPTGSGKTALLSLIPRFYDVTGGSVLVDGVDVRRYVLAALRGRIAFALQKSELFSGTLRENIAWTCPGASEDVIARAAETACLSDLMVQGQGLDTPVAERGMGLSGGQRQRVALARVLLKGGEILLMDDAASALDVETEARLWKNLARDFPGVTKIIVCQRVSTARAADRVIVLEQGRVAGCGTHDELLRSCQAYREICASQEGGGDGIE